MYAALALSDYLPPVPRNTDAARQAIWLRLLLDDLQLGVRVLRRPVIRPDVQLLRLAIVAEGGD